MPHIGLFTRSDLRVNVQDGFDEVDILVLEQIKDYTTAEKERLLSVDKEFFS